MPWILADVALVGVLMLAWRFGPAALTPLNRPLVRPKSVSWRSALREGIASSVACFYITLAVQYHQSESSKDALTSLLMVAPFVIGLGTFFEYHSTVLRSSARPGTASTRSTRLVPALHPATERLLVRVAPYLLAGSATLLSGAGLLSAESSRFGGWSLVAVVTAGWLLPCVALSLYARLAGIPRRPAAEQARLCGLGNSSADTVERLVRYGAPWGLCLGLAIAEAMTGRPFWAWDASMASWAIPGLLLGPLAAYAAGNRVPF